MSVSTYDLPSLTGDFVCPQSPYVRAASAAELAAKLAARHWPLRNTPPERMPYSDQTLYWHAATRTTQYTSISEAPRRSRLRITINYQASSVQMHGFDPLSLVVLGSYLTTIMHAGLISSVPLLFATTLACTVASIWLRFLAPPGSDPAIAGRIPTAITSAITEQ